MGMINDDMGTLPTAIRNRQAVVVGINDYPEKTGLEPLRFAEADAKAISLLLRRRCGFDVKLLVGAEATRNAIEEAVTSSDRGDTFLFYFAGHGQLLDGQYRLHSVDSLDVGFKSIVFDDLARSWQVDFGFTKILAILDACRERGTGVRGSHGLEPAAIQCFEAATKGGRLVDILYACAEGQVSFEDIDLKHGVFTAAILYVLRRHGESAELDVGGLAGKASDWMRHWSASNKGHIQTPCRYYQPSQMDRIILIEARPRLAEATMPPESQGTAVSGSVFKSSIIKPHRAWCTIEIGDTEYGSVFLHPYRNVVAIEEQTRHRVVFAHYPSGSRIHTCRSGRPLSERREEFLITHNLDWVLSWEKDSRVVCVWQIKPTFRMRKLRTRSGIEHIEVSDDGTTAVTTYGYEWSVLRCDTASKEYVLDQKVREFLTSRVSDIAVSTDGQLVAVTRGEFDILEDAPHSIEVWNVSVGKRIHWFPSQTGSRWPKFTPDGYFLLTRGSREPLRMWSTRDWSEVALYQPPWSLASYVMSSDSRHLVVTTEDELSVIELPQLRIRYSVPIERAIGNMSISRDSRYLAVPCKGQIVRIFGLSDGDELPSIGVETEHVYAIALSATGKRLAVRISEGMVQIWRLAGG